MLDWQTLIAQAPLGHKARNTRAASLLAGMLQGHATHSHGVAAGSALASPADTLGAYRFLDHDALSLPRLYQPLREALRQQTATGERLYVLHDLSPVDYTRHQRKEDLCQIGDGRGYGYELFSSLILNSAGKPLGSAVVELRTCHGLLSSQSESVLPFIDHYDQVERASVEVARILPGRELVHVADREFDELRLMRTCSPTLFVFRAQHLNRQVRHGGQLLSLRHATDSVPLTEVGTVERRVGQGQQRYTVYHGETSVTLEGPSLRGVNRKRNRPKPGQPLRLRAVVTELRAVGHKTLRWILLTNLPDSVDQVVQAYLFRWKIERLYFLCKVGFKLEDWHQETGERIARRLALVQLAAMVLYELCAAEPDSPLGRLQRRLARLGGWSGRPRDPIGPTALMRGLLRLWSAHDLLHSLGAKTIDAWCAQLKSSPVRPRPRRRRKVLIM